MSGKQWAIMIGMALVAGLGVFLGADVQIEDWNDLNVPRLVLGAIMAVVASVVSFLSKAPRQ